MGENNNCELYNPFFSNDLYFLPDNRKFWESGKLANLTKKDFD
jgi:hypothetical protein